MARPLPVMLREAYRFSLVGGLGFVVDAGLLALFTKVMGLNPFGWRLVSFLAAATVTWILHRTYTFAATGLPWRSQWLKFILFNGLGALLNFAVYFALLLYGLAPLNDPLVAVTISAIIAWIFNFIVSKYLVFGRGTAGEKRGLNA